MKINTLTEEQYIDSMDLSMYAFQYRIKEEEIAGRKEKLKDHTILGIYEDQNLAAKLHIIPLEITMGEHKWKMGGVAGVATYPEYRRKGYVRELIVEALKKMREENQIVSLLHPFDIGFYRKFGWEIFSDNQKIVIDKKELRINNIQKGRIQRFTKETHQGEIERVYQEYASKYMGMLVRDAKWWKESIYHDAQLALYRNEHEEAKGYILYKVSERKLDVMEMVALNQEARAGLWNFICQHDSMVEQVTMLLSVHDHFQYLFHQPKLKMEVYPYFMARLVDVEKCLKQYPFAGMDDSVFLHVEDEYAPWNNGSYLIGKGKFQSFKEKSGSRCVEVPKRGIHINSNALTAILFGYKRPVDLHEMELIQGSEDEIATLERMIPAKKPFFYDFF
ncbi:MAG: GNAT family N-acetyltransferase [Bacillota bacterium]|nr:GNAT family N-acetyltransferase [Bacillota bacterium]